MMPDLGVRSRAEVASAPGYDTPAALSRRCGLRVTCFVSGDRGVFIGDLDPTGETRMELMLSVLEEFLTGTRSHAACDRILASMLFTDIVDSTCRPEEIGAGGARVRRQLGPRIADPAYAGTSSTRAGRIVIVIGGERLLDGRNGRSGCRPPRRDHLRVDC